MQPLIAITAGEVVNREYPWAPVTHGQSHTYVDAVVRAGGAPIIVPIVNNQTVLRKLYDQCDGLLLSGGNDLDPRNYSSKPVIKTRRISPQRDKQEIQLLKWAFEDDKPVLGICRGMQLINVTLDGNLYQDIVTSVPTAHNHEACIVDKDFNHLAHHLKLAAGSQLAKILETDTMAANTLHHQAVHELGKGLVITARAEDGVIEAIELPGKRFVIGVQSHPETLEAGTEPHWRKLFTAFIGSCKSAKR
ncbi:MAG: gamma-glutamyl-gamma-aminobutyrate hydrolase family protein [Candidatus Binatota bacterium]|nr:gamma-glutamyl-gamma-aminobutyrate hydrolase family protein [Candidatus Binatota bacterium]